MLRLGIQRTESQRGFPRTRNAGEHHQRIARHVEIDVPRNALVGPRTWGTNLSLLKKVQITEHRYLQLRGEAYNFLNHNNLNNPNTTMSSSDFGRILSRSGNRVIQVGARFVF